MNKFKLSVVAICMVFFANLVAKADTIAFADFKKVESEYKYAVQAYKDIDTKVLELQQYVIDKDKQFKSIDSPINKKNFEEKIQREYKLKEEALLKLKLAKEEKIYNDILAATKAIRVAKKLTVVLDYRTVFAGGVDITNDIIQYLNASKK